MTNPDLDLDEATPDDEAVAVEEEPKRDKPRRPKPDKHPPNSRTNTIGDQGDDVALAQRFLGAALESTFAADGAFGPVTEKHVKRYQKMRGYPLTGVLRRDGKEWKTILDAPDGGA